jgi:hypothetical protein
MNSTVRSGYPEAGTVTFELKPEQKVIATTTSTVDRSIIYLKTSKVTRLVPPLSALICNRFEEEYTESAVVAIAVGLLSLLHQYLVTEVTVHSSER